MTLSICLIQRVLVLLVVFTQWPDKRIYVTAQTNETKSPSTRLSLAASNPFRMVLRPTPFELDFVALSIVEEAMAKSILLSTDSSLVDVSININQMNWLSSENENNQLVDGTVKTLGTEGVPTTVLKFFAVGTFLLKTPSNSGNGSGSLAAVKALDEIVEKAFKQANNAAFLELLKNSGDPLLDGIQDAAAIRTSSNVPVPNTPDNVDEPDDDEPEAGRPPLTTFDIVLIIASVSILLGVVYMIYVHHRDRGYIENQRVQTLNLQGRNNETSTNYSPGRGGSQRSTERSTSIAVNSISDDSSKTSVINNRQGHDEQPSNVSSLFTSHSEGEDNSFVTTFSLPPNPTDINTHLNSRKSRFSSRVRISVESLQCDSRSLPTPTKKALTSTSSVQSMDDECKSTGAISITALSAVLSSEFGPINWFRNSASKRPPPSLLEPTDDCDGIQSIADGDMAFLAPEGSSTATSKNSSTSSSSEGSSESEDVFQVGHVTTNVIATGSVGNGGDTVSSKASSSVVTEWMKTIQVISSADSRSGSEVTCEKESSDQTSTAENSSAEAPSVEEDEADDIVSLEHSMANSRGATVGVTEDEDGSTMEF